LESTPGNGNVYQRKDGGRWFKKLSSRGEIVLGKDDLGEGERTSKSLGQEKKNRTPGRRKPSDKHLRRNGLSSWTEKAVGAMGRKDIDKQIPRETTKKSTIRTRWFKEKAKLSSGACARETPKRPSGRRAGPSGRGDGFTQY